MDVTFTDDDGTTRTEAREVETREISDAAGEKRLANNLFAELRVDVSEQEAPKHYATARGWVNFGKQSVSAERFFEDYFNVQNPQAMWVELCNLVLRTEADLALAQSFKNLEPAAEPNFEDEVALNDLHYIHGRKMDHLNSAVQNLIKVQNLVDRLLHESLGGDLVDTSDPDWERDKLNRKNVKKGLKSKLASGAISQAQFDAIMDALEIPKKHPKADIALSYRNRLSHHPRPSVDYPMFFSPLESRKGEPIVNAGKVVGRKHEIGSHPPLQYKFRDLRAAFTEYLDAVASMLQKLNETEIRSKRSSAATV
jgi:hypothetical protein